MTEAESQERALRRRREEAAAEASREARRGWARFWGENLVALLTSIFLVFAPCLTGVALSGVSELLGKVFVGLSLFGAFFAVFTFLVYTVGRLSRSRGASPAIGRAYAIRTRLEADPDFDGTTLEGELTEVGEATEFGGALSESAQASTGALSAPEHAGAARGAPSDVADEQVLGLEPGTPGFRGDQIPMTYVEAMKFSAKFSVVALGFLGGIWGLIMIMAAGMSTFGPFGAVAVAPPIALLWGLYTLWERRRGPGAEGTSPTAEPGVPGRAEVVLDLDGVGVEVERSQEVGA